MEEYLDRKKSELNVEKKIMRCRKGEKKERKIDQRWRGKKLQEVKVYKYIEYIVQRNRGQQTQMREGRRKAVIAMREVWGIGKKLWEKDWNRRIWFFDILVWTVMKYGIEIWMKGKKEDRGDARKIYKMDNGDRWTTPG